MRFLLSLFVALIVPFAVSAAALPVPLPNALDHVLGRKNVPITVITYADYECPFCRRNYVTVKRLLRAYPGKVNAIDRHYPLSFHVSAEPSAIAAECVARTNGNGGYWTFVNRVMAGNAANYRAYGLAISKDAAAFRACLDGRETATVVGSQAAEAIAAGVSGTPTSFLVNTTTGRYSVIVGAQTLERYVEEVEKLLK